MFKSSTPPPRLSAHTERRVSHHLPEVGEEPVSEVLRGSDGELSGKVVDGAHEDPVALHAAGASTPCD